MLPSPQESPGLKANLQALLVTTEGPWYACFSLANKIIQFAATVFLYPNLIQLFYISFWIMCFVRSKNIKLMGGSISFILKLYLCIKLHRYIILFVQLNTILWSWTGCAENAICHHPKEKVCMIQGHLWQKDLVAQEVFLISHCLYGTCWLEEPVDLGKLCLLILHLLQTRP